MNYRGFEAVIGLEVHVQLATRTKIFCGCLARPEGYASVAEVPMNLYTCEVCTAQPGALPVMNEEAVRLAVMAGIALGSDIAESSQFARKNYFYPDLPKGYQISQFDLPVCVGGEVVYSLDGNEKKTRLTRIHLEEDAGKSVHAENSSVVNLNRAGVPLVEVVSEPDLRTPEEAGAYLRSLHATVVFLGISDGNMQEGNFRCDANVSVRKVGEKKFGTRVEVKNVNSFKFVEKAILHEIHRQIDLIESGGKVVQETRSYDPDLDSTESMRTKEEAEDYRYFPDPDLRPLKITQSYQEEVKRSMPELPSAMKARWETELGLSSYDAGVIVADPEVARYFDRACGDDKTAKTVSNLLTQEMLKFVNQTGMAFSEAAKTIPPDDLLETAKKVVSGKLNASHAKKAVALTFQTASPAGGKARTLLEVIEQEGMEQVADDSQIIGWVDQVIAANPTQIEELRTGKDKVMGFLMGQVMKVSGGKAPPAKVQQLIRERISK